MPPPSMGLSCHAAAVLFHATGLGILCHVAAAMPPRTARLSSRTDSLPWCCHPSAGGKLLKASALLLQACKARL